MSPSEMPAGMLWSAVGALTPHNNNQSSSPTYHLTSKEDFCHTAHLIHHVSTGTAAEVIDLLTQHNVTAFAFAAT